MNLTDDEVLYVLRLLDRSDYDFLELERGDLKVTVVKGAGSPTEAPAETPPEEAKLPIRRAGLVAIPSPIVGIFYAAPDPHAPPFVEKGTRVTEDSTVGLIEVMKVFNGIRAGVDGVIAEILVANTELVETGQELFLVAPGDPV